VALDWAPWPEGYELSRLFRRNVFFSRYVCWFKIV
jgi:hypothetical protein